MNSELNQAEIKKPYESPKVTTISLRPEEAVLGHCKMSGSGGGPNPPTCAALFCMSIGS
jgi:hypothetical protein